MASQAIPKATAIFYPSAPMAAENLKSTSIFTRIHIIATSAVISEALTQCPNLNNAFLLGHHNDVLVLDRKGEENITHVSALLDMCMEKGLKRDIKLCAFDKLSWGEAGFYIELVEAGERLRLWFY